MSKDPKNQLSLGWLMFFITALFYFYEYLLRVMPASMFNFFSNTYHLSSVQMGSIDSAYYWAYTPLQLFVGPLIDQFGVKNLTMIAVALCIVGTYLIGFIHLYDWILFGRFMIGFGSAFAFVAVLKVASVWLPKKYFSFVTGTTTSLGMLGAILGQVLITELFDSFGHSNTFFLILFLGLFILIITALFIQDKPRRISHKPGRRIKILTKSLFTVGTNPQVILSGMLGAGLFMPTLIFCGFWGRPYFEQIHHASSLEASLMTSLVFWGWIVGGPLSGIYSSKLDNRRIFIRTGSLISAIILITLIYLPVTNHFVIYILMFFLGLFSSVEILVFSLAADHCSRHYTATAVAVTNMIVMTSGFLQPYIGRSLENFRVTPTSFSEEGFQQSLIILPASLLLCYLFSFLIREKKHGNTE
ncbi:MAG TPA: MFS transporter [Gammaproteobacteria bacterium]|nr:MFS transporter [Gammaproteobacteria bacterium]